MSETGNCAKCESEISVTADRCPECGYEPSESSTIWRLLAFAGVAFGSLVLLGSIIQASDGIPVSIWTWVIGGFLTVYSAATIYRQSKLSSAKAIHDADDFVNPFN